ncbi:hypothetical protein ACPPVU_15330 [Mucilaginibacter sp. McL0603]|uniref:hypothetical protein n=1 Tax=Mucilaginibacter sp. McL0603 TaxID=3415670 RepID=UPI003CE7216E
MKAQLPYPKNLIASLVFIFVIATIGCNKIHIFPKAVPPALPAETHVGKKTFGFNLNGQLWLPNTAGPDAGPALTSYLQFNSFTLAANRLNQHITFNIPNVTSTGSYDLTTNVNVAIFFSDTTRYKCTQGTMDITYFDGQKGIISGIFSMKAASPAGNEVTIDQGRFDMTF